MKSFGTEGRQQPEIAPSDAVHPYLLFRGQDIQDLHVHEDQPDVAVVGVAAAAAGVDSEHTTGGGPAAAPATQEPLQTNAMAQPRTAATNEHRTTTTTTTANTTITATNTTNNNNNNNNTRGPPKPRAAVGTGASLLHRSVRGKQTNVPVGTDFDFAAHVLNDDGHHDNDNNEAGDHEPPAYDKDDFFDSISCDAIDKEQGRENRLRGSVERKLNAETFGAVALGHGRRRGHNSGRGGRGGRGRGGRNNSSQRNNNKNNTYSSKSTTTTASI